MTFKAFKDDMRPAHRLSIYADINDFEYVRRDYLTVNRPREVTWAQHCGPDPNETFVPEFLLELAIERHARLHPEDVAKAVRAAA